MSLSSEQAGVVSSTTDHNLIVALPGAGKTFTMISYIEKLVMVPDNRIVALTFTKAAAEEMKNRVGKKVFGAQRKQLHVSTFHSLILKQAKKHVDFSGRKLLSGNASDRLSNHIAESYRVKMGLQEEVTIIELVTHSRSGEEYDEPKEKSRQIPFKRVCNQLLKEFIATPYHDEIEFEYSSVFKNGIEDFYEYYLEQLYHLKSWPMDVMCVEVTRALLIGDIEPINLTHLIVDEFQDTDPVQYAWVKCHGIAGAKITVVGDDDQAIYSFRGSMGVGGMRLFQENFDVKYHTLSTCFRCGNEILTMAGKLVSFNNDRIAKKMNSAANDDGEVNLLYYESAEDESDGIGEGLLDNIGQSRAVLARTNSELNFIEGFLKCKGIECYRMNGTSIWESDSLKIYLHFLCVILQIRANTHLTPLLVYLGEAQSNVLQINSSLNGLSFVHCELDSNDWLKKTVELQNFCKERWHLSSTSDESKMIGLIDDIAEEFGSIMNKGVKDFAKLFKDILITMSGSTFGRRVEEMERMSQQRSKQAVADESVILTTFHGSKGLEWDYVWLMGLDDENIPHQMPGTKLDDSLIEEERRLLYVAMTRAKSKLSMSWVSTACRFLKESFAVEDSPLEE